MPDMRMIIKTGGKIARFGSEFFTFGNSTFGKCVKLLKSQQLLSSICQWNPKQPFLLLVDNKTEKRNFHRDKNENQVLYAFLTVTTEIRTSEFEHVPVLFDEAVSSLGLEKNRPITVIDATLGLGGHASEIVKRLPEKSTFVGFDRDRTNLEQAKNRVLCENETAIRSKGLRLEFVESDFRKLKEKLSDLGISRIDSILYDLGVSSAHYDDGERGFSFRFDGPLDMRFNRTDDSPTAADFLARASEPEILRVLRDYGEEPKAFFIAKAVVETRKAYSLKTTGDFLKLIEEASFDPKSKTRAFQAIRIAVNDEFGSIEDSLRQAVELLRPEGRLSVITFHSLEDRLVKTVFKEFERDVPDELTGMPIVKALLKKAHKKPIEPNPEEVKNNPRSRSAKLRVCEKIRTTSD